MHIQDLYSKASDTNNLQENKHVDLEGAGEPGEETGDHQPQQQGCLPEDSSSVGGP